MVSEEEDEDAAVTDEDVNVSDEDNADTFPQDENNHRKIPVEGVLNIRSPLIIIMMMSLTARFVKLRQDSLRQDSLKQ